MDPASREKRERVDFDDEARPPDTRDDPSPQSAPIKTPAGACVVTAAGRPRMWPSSHRKRPPPVEAFAPAEHALRIRSRNHAMRSSSPPASTTSLRIAIKPSCANAVPDCVPVPLVFTMPVG